MASPRFRFHLPEHGWMAIEVSTPAETLREDVSDVPVDPISRLLACLIRVAGGSPQEQVEWNLEPISWEWTFRTCDDSLELQIAADGQVGSTFVAERRVMLRALCRSLLHLQSAAEWSSEEVLLETWSWPFPGKALATLRSLVLD